MAGDTDKRWTLKIRIRTPEIQAAAQIPVEVDLADKTVPVFKRIASRATELRTQGLSDRAIGRELGVDPKTAHKAYSFGYTT